MIRNEDVGPLNTEELNVGDEVEAVVTNIDTKRNRVRLSVRRLEVQKERAILDKVNDDSSMTLGDIIKDQIN